MTGRAAKVARAQELRARGLTLREIGAAMGVARSTASAYLTDPDLAKQKARRAGYAGTCVDCGAATYGGNGRAAAPERCEPCYRLSIRADHGTLGRYNSGCSCDDCRRANREHTRSLKGKKPPNHGHSGYVNYGCRCPVCTRAHADYLWLTNHSERYGKKRATA